jgi:hypothetical protein
MSLASARVRLWHIEDVRYVLALALTACSPFTSPPPVVAVAAAPPLMPAPPTTYIENAYTFNYITPPVEPTPEPETAPKAAPPDVRTAIPSSYCACIASASLPPDRQQGASTTVATCDDYLARTEISVRCSTSLPGPIERVTASLDLARRSWRTAAATSVGRASLVDSCGVAINQLASATSESCGGNHWKP